VVYGLAFHVAQRPEGLVSPATAALQMIAKAGKSQIAPTWAVFPVAGRDIVLVGFLSARTPKHADAPWGIEPGAPLARVHLVTAYACGSGATVGRQREDRVDADCVVDFVRSLAETPAWQALGATPLDATTLPGGAGLDAGQEPAFFVMTDDGRGADVVLGMSFWKAGEVYAGGRVETWTRPVGDDDVVRVVGVRATRVDRETPLVVAPPRQSPEAYALHDGIVQETRAVLDSPRPFGWYFIADVAG